MLIAVHHVALQSADPIPEWIHLVPAGVFSGVDGRGPYRLRDAVAVIQASMAAANGKLAVDENHAIDLAAKTGGRSPARGWIVEMQARPDGIWGRVEWTPTGHALLEERAYKGISPVFGHEKDGTVVSVLRAALTNAPNLAQLTTLHQQQEPSMDLNALRTALGLPETADEAAILAAAQAQAATVAQHAQQLVALQSQVASQTDLTQTVVTLQTQLATMQAETARAAAVAFVDGAIRAGKPIAPVRDHYIARHVADPKSVETEINALPSINAGGIVQHAAQGGDADGQEAMSAMDREVCHRMGITPDKWAAHSARMKKGGMKADGSPMWGVN